MQVRGGGGGGEGEGGGGGVLDLQTYGSVGSIFDGASQRASTLVTKVLAEEEAKDPWPRS